MQLSMQIPYAGDHEAIADGWLPLFFVPDQANEVFGPSLRAGQVRRDPALGPLDICAGGLVAIGEEKDVAAVRDIIRPFVAEYVGGNAARGQNYYKTLYSATATGTPRPRSTTSTSRASSRRPGRRCPRSCSSA